MDTVYTSYTTDEIHQFLKNRTLHFAIKLGKKIMYIKAVKKPLLDPFHPTTYHLPPNGLIQARMDDDHLIIKAYK